MTTALKEFCEAEETEIITCEYCKEKTSLESALIDENRFFCCEGCIEKYQEKQKREKFQAVELPQDTIQRLQRENEELRQNAKKHYKESIIDLINKGQVCSNCENEFFMGDKYYTYLKEGAGEGFLFCCLDCMENYERTKIKDLEDFVIPISKMGKSVGTMVSENVVKGLQEEVEALQFINNKFEKEIEALKTKNDNLIIENTDLKEEKELFQKENLAWEDAVIKSDTKIKEQEETITSRTARIHMYITEVEELKREIETQKIRADGYRRNSELLASEQAGVKLEKREVEERLKKAGKFIDDALKIAEADSSVFVLLMKVKEIVGDKNNELL